MKIRVQNKIIRLILSIRVQKIPSHSFPFCEFCVKNKFMSNLWQIHEHSCSKESGRNM